MIGASVSAQKSISVVAVAPYDWVVREDGGRELGHYLTRAEAVAVGRKLAQKRAVELVVQDASGKPGGTDPVAKEAYVTAVGNQGCGVGYYK
jgi:hypothetical protein